MKFTSTLLKQAWTLARKVAGSASAKPFFGWALKEIRTMTSHIESEKARMATRAKREADEIRAQMQSEIEGMGVAPAKVAAAAEYLASIEDVQILCVAEGRRPDVIKHVQCLIG